MIRTNTLSAAGLAISLLSAIAGCAAGGTGSTADAPDRGPLVTPDRPESLGLREVPHLDVTIGAAAEPALSATVDTPILRVRPGAESTLEVNLDRSGFVGEVAVWTEGLPTNLVSQPAVMPGSVPTGRLVVGATASAEIGGPHAFRVLVAAAGAEDPIEIPAQLFVAGEPGSLDTTFGAGGVASFEGPSMGTRSVAVDSQGRVLVAGRDWDARTMLLERVTADGELDESYGEAARAALPDTEFSSGSRMVLVGDEARVLMTFGSYGEATVEIGLVAFDATGRPDATVGTSGVIVANRLPVEDFGSFALTAGAGSVFFRVGDRFASLRSDGTVEEIDVPVGGATAHAMAYWNDTMTFGVSGSGSEPMLERVHTAGGRDDRFGEGGALQAPSASAEELTSGFTFQLEQLADGSGFAGTNLTFADGVLGEVVRFTAEGQLDETFGDRGSVIFDGERLVALAIDSAGRPVVLTEERPSYERRLRRYTTAGRPDRGFGNEGVVELASIGLNRVRHMAHGAAADRVVVCGAEAHGWSCGRLWL